MLHVAVDELMLCTKKQVATREFGLGVQDGHDVLQLITEAKRAPGLVEAAACVVATPDRLVKQPAIGKQVDGGFRGFYLDYAQGALPTDADFVECVEAAVGIAAQKNFLPLQPGDVLRTWADVAELAELIDFRPATTLQTGVSHFVNWYRDYYAV